MKQKISNILVLDADHLLGKVLATVLSEAGHRVVTHARQDGDGTDLVCADVSLALAEYDAVYGPFDHVIFGLRDLPEPGDALAAVLAVERDLAMTLGELKACTQVLTRRDDSQLWVMLQEDSMQYYLPLQNQPMRSRALMAAVKSLAKEVFCFGIKVNALQIQPMQEQFEAAMWKQAKHGLKAYALKFKPQKSADVAQLVRSLIELPRLPMVGMVIPVGVGFPEANI
jgi:NAD(P)-dependent dehydrogenase (short-subunit alcohol dehydrogenase family)